MFWRNSFLYLPEEEDRRLPKNNGRFLPEHMVSCPPQTVMFIITVLISHKLHIFVFYLQSNNISSISPTFKCFFIHFVSVEVTTLVSVWIDMLIFIVCSC